MKFSKEILEQVKRGETSEEVLAQNIIAVNPLQDIISFVIETLKKEVDNTPITISMEDYEKIISMFRIRGVKTISTTGEMVVESRGRKPKIHKG